MRLTCEAGEAHEVLCALVGDGRALSEVQACEAGQVLADLHEHRACERYAG